MMARRSIVNGLSLYALQGIRLLLPLATVPYVTRVLGPGGYGQFAAGLNVIGYFTVVVTYGFDLTGVRAVALARRDGGTAVFAEIVTAKSLLGVLSLVVAGVAVASGLFPEAVAAVIVVLTIMIVSAILQQAWWFQGMQRSQYILVANILGYAISTILILWLVRTPNDVLVYAACYASASLIGAMLSLLFVGTRVYGRAVMPRATAVWSRLKDGFPVFVTSMLSVIIAGFGLTYMTIVGIDAVELGIYAGAYKLASVLIALYTPLTQAWFPRASQRFAVDFHDGLRKCRRFIYLSGISYVVIAGVIGGVAPVLLPFIFGPQFRGGEYVLYPLLIWVVLGVVNNGLGVQVLVSSGHSVEYAKVFVFGALAVLVLTPLGVTAAGALGAAYAMMGAEAALLVGNVIQVFRVSRQHLQPPCDPDGRSGEVDG